MFALMCPEKQQSDSAHWIGGCDCGGDSFEIIWMTVLSPARVLQVDEMMRKLLDTEGKDLGTAFRSLY